jgi:hypothetical protein
MPTRKLDIVTRLRDGIPEEHRESIEQAMITWWANLRPEGGLRLTNHGYRILHSILKLESWQLDLANENHQSAHRSRISKRTILDLDHKLEWPYYLDFDSRNKTKRIIFFGSREALMAQMYGDLDRWLETVISRHNDDHDPGS